MLVIAMIGIFIGATNSFNWKPQTDIEKANRIKYAVSDKLRDESLKIFTGHMPNYDGEIARETTLTIGSGGIETTYKDANGVILSTGTFQRPFYDGDRKYSIINVAWCTGSTIESAVWNGTGQILMTQTGTFFSTGSAGVINRNIIMLFVEVWYDSRSRKVSFDRRTGKISVDS